MPSLGELGAAGGGSNMMTVLGAKLSFASNLSPLGGAGGGDNMMSALGAGAVKEGTLVVSLGTSGEGEAALGLVPTTASAARSISTGPFCTPSVCVINAGIVLLPLCPPTVTVCLAQNNCPLTIQTPQAPKPC